MKKFNEWVQENYDVPEMTPGGDSFAMPLAQTEPTPTDTVQKMSLPAMLKRRVMQVVEELSNLKENGQNIPPQKIIQMLAQVTQELMTDTNINASGIRKASRMAANNAQ